MLIGLAIRRSTPWVLALGLLAPPWGIAAGAPKPATQAPAPPGPAATTPPSLENRSLMQLGPGDSVAVQVYGQPDMGATVYVSDDGTIPMPLAGAVQVAGMSPAEAARQIEGALRSGKFLVDPHVTITVTQSRSQRVSVLGEVGTPGRYTIESNETIFDLLAQAGGTKETSADVAYLMRTDKNGTVERFEVNLKPLTGGQKPLPTRSLQGGDSVYVPRAEQFYIFGEVTTPNMYRIEPGMTVLQAIARAGGITPRGSKSRLEIKRKGADGKEVTIKARGDDPVKADDVIRVKESIF
ncbi:MAG TPA: SLBB domain-containing protein [Steroidobacteraceae bacterium]|nr:SLBB domain-containing protein [Steroidobacteraceae bacterium]